MTSLNSNDFMFDWRFLLIGITLGLLFHFLGKAGHHYRKQEVCWIQQKQNEYCIWSSYALSSACEVNCYHSNSGCYLKRQCCGQCSEQWSIFCGGERGFIYFTSLTFILITPFPPSSFIWRPSINVIWYTPVIMSLLPLHRWSRRYVHVCTGVFVENEEAVPRDLVKGLIYLCTPSTQRAQGEQLLLISFI